MTGRLIWAAGWLALLGASTASANDRVTVSPAVAPVPGDEFEVRLVPDLVLTAGMFGVALLLDASKVELAGDGSCPEGPPGESEGHGGLRRPPRHPLDRWATGLAVQGASELSDILLVASLSAPLAFAGVDMASDRLSPCPRALRKRRDGHRSDLCRHLPADLGVQGRGASTSSLQLRPSIRRRSCFR